MLTFLSIDIKSGRDEHKGKWTIKIFGGTRQGWRHLPDPFPPTNNFCLYPPLFKTVLERFLNEPHAHHPISSIFHCYPSPSTSPAPHKSFDRTLRGSKHIVIIRECRRCRRPNGVTGHTTMLTDDGMADCGSSRIFIAQVLGSL